MMIDDSSIRSQSSSIINIIIYRMVKLTTGFYAWLMWEQPDCCAPPGETVYALQAQIEGSE
jgi:hypothetical protein